MRQALALQAVRSDVAAKIDRLEAHVAAARRRLASEEPVGGTFDFLVQEFNREAKRPCSKAQHPGLTRIGLDLWTVIDQMRDQAANLD